MNPKLVHTLSKIAHIGYPLINNYNKNDFNKEKKEIFQKKIDKTDIKIKLNRIYSNKNLNLRNLEFVGKTNTCNYTVIDQGLPIMTDRGHEKLVEYKFEVMRELPSLITVEFNLDDKNEVSFYINEIKVERDHVDSFPDRYLFYGVDNFKLNGNLIKFDRIYRSCSNVL